MSPTGTVRRALRSLVIMGSGLLLAAVIIFVVVVRMVIAGFAGTATLPVECAIVFGAAVHPVYDPAGTIIESQSGPGIRRRMLTAVELYRQGLVRKLFLSGGKGDGMVRSEAQIMKQYALLRHVPERDIVVEDQSASTKENLLNTRPLVKDCSSVVGISDRYHLARIAFLARQQGWDLPTFPAREIPTGPFEGRSVVREAMAMVWYGLVW